MRRAEIGNATGSSPRARGTPADFTRQSGIARFIPASAGNTFGYCSRCATESVHPRERGEHAPAPEPGGFDDGSSPRARGTLRAVGRHHARQRFIPASAGNTSNKSARKRVSAVHPRERGEHLEQERPQARLGGSSPRARGTLVQAHEHDFVVRFIPASAGNTAPRAPGGTGRPVHPRERGEHLAAVDDAGDGVRFIPASAGNTRRCPRGAGGTPVHPRERGEHCIATSWAAHSVGSSPRARGTPVTGNQCIAESRFIPASAGNTSQTKGCPPCLPVHPRERGEHYLEAAKLWGEFGSSPRARGTPGSTHGATCNARFIPASAGNTAVLRFLSCVPPGSSPRARGTRRPAVRRGRDHRFIPASAGNTRADRAHTPAVAVHPRERGEHAASRAGPSVVVGSSPRARGTRRTGRLRDQPERFIPASAGNTACPGTRLSHLTVHPRERGEHLIARFAHHVDFGSSPRARGTPDS